MHHIISLFIICASLWGQQSAPDVYGWNGTKWGMSLAEVKAAVSYPIEPIPDPTPGMPAKDTFWIPVRIEINDFPVKITLHFSNDRLKMVELVLADKGRSAAFQSDAFAALKQSLIEKYGKPANEDSKHIPTAYQGDTGRTDHTVLWSFPSTSIKLHWLETDSYGVIGVQYQQVDKTAPL